MSELQVKEVTAVAVLDKSSEGMPEKIKAARAKALHRIDLSSVNSNLLNAAGLLHVAHQALAGTKIQSKLTGLKFKLMEACDASLNTISDFSEQDDDIINYIVDAYNFLLCGEEEAALNSLANCKEVASNMSGACEQLIKAFDELATKSLQALEESQDEQAVKYAQMDEVRSQLNQLRASLEESKTIAEQLATDIEDVAADLVEATKAEDAAAIRKAQLETTALWSSVLSGGLAALGGVMSLGISAATGSKTTTTAETDSTTKAALEASKKAKEEENKLEKAQKEKQALMDEKDPVDEAVQEGKEQLTQAKDELEEAKSELENAEDGDLKNQAALAVTEKEKKVKDTQKQLTADENRQKKLAEKIQAKDEVIQGLQAAFKNLSDTATTLAKSAQDELSQRMEASNELRKHKAQLQKERRATLGNMKKMAVMVAGTKQEKNSIATAIKTLQLAIICLQQVTLALYQASQFWKNIESYCSKLADPSVEKKIKSIAKVKDAQNRIAGYKENRFMTSMMDYIASWYALNDIYAEYLEAAGKTGDIIARDFKVSLVREQAWKNAAEQAKAFIEDIDAQLAQVAANEQDIVEEANAELAIKDEIVKMLQ